MWRFTFVITTIFLFTIQLTAQSEFIKAELIIADELVARQNYAEALTHINLVLDEEPFYLDALEKKLNVMLLDGQMKVMQKEIDQKINENLQQPEYYYIRGILNNYRHRSSKALDDFENADYYQLPEEYRDRFYLNRGVTYYNLARFSDAEKDFRSALDINPRYATVYHSWGMLDYEEGRYENAVEKFTKAVEFGSERAILFFNLGMSYKRLGDMVNACYNFNEACRRGYQDACKLHFLQCGEAK